MRSPVADSVRDRLQSSVVSGSKITLEQLLCTASRDRMTAACIVSADGREMNWQQLLQQLVRTRAALRSIGVGPDDRVAVALPNGPTLAAVFLGIANCAGCAPLNTAYTADECEFYLRDLDTKALITRNGAAPAAVEVAARLKIPVIECDDDGDIPGRFTLDTSRLSGHAAFGSLSPDTVALYLYTSGTTSRPKLVPLRHKNLIASAHNMVRTLELSSSDRCLNLMPLFHIHGLVGGLLAPLAGGGSTVCPPSLRPGDFVRWMEATRPTWYTAVPTMHRMIANEAKAHPDLIARHPLRFIRSSSAPLPAQLFDQLTSVFGAPVLEAYSMTEAAHQMTCNPLGTERQKRGTVGVAAGPDVAIMSEAGRLLERGETGEVVIRGPSVMDGYVANPQANAGAFTDGWFRTGDQGRFDDDGYLVLTGRLKEQINRGGEKFAPLEIDHALLAHPEISEAAAFGFPHPTLGQDVAAAVVMRQGAQATPADIQSFLRERLATFKIPRRILVVSAIPKGPTGKVQRSQLHTQLAVNADPPEETRRAEPRPVSNLESALLRLWRETLESEAVGLDDDFFEMGGDSLMAVEMLLEVEKIVGHSIPESMLVDHPTIAQLARGLASAAPAHARTLIQLQKGDARPPLFFFHGDYDGGYYTRRVARLLGPDQPFISVAPHGLGSESIPESIEAMAFDRLRLILDAQPEGPFRLAGYCNGGLVVLALAKLLVEAGRQVDAVFLIDTPTLNFRPTPRLLFQALTKRLDAISPKWEQQARPLAVAVDVAWRQIANLQVYRRHPMVLGQAVRKLIRPGRAVAKFVRPDLARLSDEARQREQQMARIYNRLFRKYIPPKIDLPVIYFAAENNGKDLRHLGLNVEIVDVPGGHWGCITTHVDALTRELGQRLRALDSAAVVQSASLPVRT
ncbi:MAG: AMP-binding protein [Rhizobiales bacterium]|nr:AMP-binding protein [Hyphomicrobiales bacterium]